jgi:hypothetical protein
MRPTYAPTWTTALEKDKSAYLTLLEKDPFEKWELNRMPEGTAERLLVMGTEVLFGDRADALGSAFIEKALQVADRALAEHKYESALCQNAFPLNRGHLERVRVLATGILRRSLDVEALRRSSDDCAAWCEDYQRREWDSQAEAYYLAAVRMALLAMDAGRTERLLSLRRPFKWHRIEHELLKDIATSLAAARPITDPSLAQRFMGFFDRVRDPAFKPDVFTEVRVQRLELGLLWDSGFVSDGQTINWSRAIDAVAA